MRPWIAPLLGLLLSACAVAPPGPGTTDRAVPDWRAPDVPRQWALEGRASIRTGSDGGTLSLFWRQSGERHYRIHLRAPFGAGSVRIQGRPQSVTLRTGDGEVHRAASARDLLYAQTGYDLPVSLLAWWVRGVPAPGRPSRVWLGEAGQPTRIEQAGWNVRYHDFTRVGDYLLPQRLDVSRGEIEVRLAVGQWRL